MATITIKPKDVVKTVSLKMILGGKAKKKDEHEDEGHGCGS